MPHYPSLTEDEYLDALFKHFPRGIAPGRGRQAGLIS